MKVIIQEPAPNKVLINNSNNTVKVIENITINPINVPGTSSNAGTISSGIFVTNTIGDAISGSIYGAGTSVEAILRDIIGPYWEPTIDFISFVINGQNGINKIALGTAPPITTVQLTIGNSINMLSTQYGLAVSITNQGGTQVGFVSKPPIYTSDQYFASIVNNATITATSVETNQNYTISLSYRNEANTQTQSISKTYTIESRKKCMLLASPLANISNLQDFLSGATIMDSSLNSKDSITDEIEVLLNCTSAAANQDNYVYLLLPATKSIREAASTTSGVGVANITDSWQLVTTPQTSWDYTEGIATYPVKLYRSTQPGPYNENIILDFTII